MDITKRNGSTEQYDKEKIATAIKKSFISTKHEIDDATIYKMVQSVEDIVCTNHIKQNVESIQDEVEKALMKNGYYAEAKSFILFRWQRTEIRRTYRRIAEDLQDEHITEVLKHIAADFTDKEYSILLLIDKYASFSKAGMTATERMDALIKAAVELTTQEAPEWEFIAARLLNYQLNKRIARFEDSEGLMSLYDKLKFLTDRNLYGAYILQQYSKAEIEQAATFMDASRNHLLNYSGLELLIKRYVIRNFDNSPIESVQEMFLGIALHLAMNEPQDRMMWVQRFYNMLSKLQVTMATPTLSNARKPFHQLSSCFIDTVPDSLEGIYRSIDNFAQVSKFGGGMGLYFG